MNSIFDKGEIYKVEKGLTSGMPDRNSFESGVTSGNLGGLAFEQIVIISTILLNDICDYVIALPIVSEMGDLPIHCQIDNSLIKGTVICNDVLKLEKSKLKECIGRISGKELNMISQRLGIVFEMDEEFEGYEAFAKAFVKSCERNEKKDKRAKEEVDAKLVSMKDALEETSEKLISSEERNREMQERISRLTEENQEIDRLRNELLSENSKLRMLLASKNRECDSLDFEECKRESSAGDIKREEFLELVSETGKLATREEVLEMSHLIEKRVTSEIKELKSIILEEIKYSKEAQVTDKRTRQKPAVVRDKKRIGGSMIRRVPGSLFVKVLYQD